METEQVVLTGIHKRARGWLWATLAICVVLALCIGLFLWLSPAQAARNYLVATYTQIYTPEHVSVQVVAPGLNEATVRVTARFMIDPDYGNQRAGENGAEYREDVQFVRQGLRWAPAEGEVLSSGATYGVFNGEWVATDPQVEATRVSDVPCG